MNIRNARLEDVPGILELVNTHVKRGDLLPRTADSIAATLDDWLIGKDEQGNIVACVSLLHYTPALAEVRSLAVADEVQGQGYGRTIVKALIAQARRRNVPTLFALTRAVPFFQKMGFHTTHKERFPEKVWRDCSMCPLLQHCDETAVVMQLAPIQPTSSIPVPIPLRQRVSAPASLPFHEVESS